MKIPSTWNSLEKCSELLATQCFRHDVHAAFWWYFELHTREPLTIVHNPLTRCVGYRLPARIRLKQAESRLCLVVVVLAAGDAGILHSYLFLSIKLIGFPANWCRNGFIWILLAGCYRQWGFNKLCSEHRWPISKKDISAVFTWRGQTMTANVPLLLF